MRQITRAAQGLSTLLSAGAGWSDRTIGLLNHLTARSVISKVPAKHERRSSLPDLSELFTGFPLWAGFRPIFDTHLIRLEDEIEDGRYVLRAELPGIDPAKDVDITVRKAQRFGLGGIPIIAHHPPERGRTLRWPNLRLPGVRLTHLLGTAPLQRKAQQAV